MKIAIVHDYLNQYGGAERVLEVFHRLFPQAPIFTLVYDKKVLPQYHDWDIRPSFLQRVPFARRRYRNFMFLFPLAMRLLKLKEFDVVFTITHAWGKGVKLRRTSCHICFCLTPIRYFWDLYEDYKNFRYLNPLLRMALPLFVRPIRGWDVRSAQRVDHFVAISKVVSERIKKFYDRDSTVIYPSVDTSFFKPSGQKSGDYFLTVSRLKEYKRIDIIIEAFNYLGLPLKIIGTGELMERLKRIARDNIEFVGSVSDNRLLSYYQSCRALVFAGYEDFGLVPLEAQACAKPVIAFAKGGLLETVVEGETGVFFKEQTPSSLIEAIKGFEKVNFDPKRIRDNALRFDRRIFEEKIKGYIDERFVEYKEGGMLRS